VTGERAVLLYDEDCGFCRWSLAKILAWDRAGRIRPVPLQSPEAEKLLPGIEEDRRMSSWHLVTDDGQVASAGAAVAPLAELLPLGAPVALVARALPGATERLYQWVANHRDELGRRLGAEACSVDPTRVRRAG
jgi:predicted DCC family thiol-disulfide oxidoreductase YuxK